MPWYLLLGMAAECVFVGRVAHRIRIQRRPIEEMLDPMVGSRCTLDPVMRTAATGALMEATGFSTHAATVLGSYESCASRPFGTVGNLDPQRIQKPGQGW